MALPLQAAGQAAARAVAQSSCPTGEGWAYEPKYDGFRALAFVDGDEVFLQSRNGRPLAPLLPRARVPDGPLRARRRAGDPRRRRPRGVRRASEPAAPGRVAGPDARRADAGAVSRLRPARGRRSTRRSAKPFAERRAALEELIDGFEDPGSVELTPLVDDPAEAEPWLETGEGVIAKQLDSPVPAGRAQGDGQGQAAADDRRVVAGWRPGKEEGTVGSLMLGLYDTAGELHVVGHTSGLKAKEKRELVAELAPYETGERGSADPSRWSADRDLEWVAPAPRAGDRGELRPRQRRAHPPRREDPALARGQEAGGLHARAARPVAPALFELQVHHLQLRRVLRPVVGTPRDGAASGSDPIERHNAGATGWSRRTA